MKWPFAPDHLHDYLDSHDQLLMDPETCFDNTL